METPITEDNLPFSFNEPESKPHGIIARILLGLLFVAVMALVIVVISRLWPFFVAESSRVPWGGGWLMWIGDVMALFWFMQFCISHVFGSGASHGAWRKRRNVILSIVLSLVVDASISGMAAYGEKVGHERSVQTTGRVTSVRQTVPRYEGDTFFLFQAYVYTYEFTDSEGHTYVGRSHLHLEQDGTSPQPPLSEATVKRLVGFQVPFEIDVRYDPEHPKRSWVENVPWYGDSRSLWGYSLMFCTVFIPFLGALFILDLLLKHAPPSIARWRDLYKVVPLALELLFIYGFCLPLA